jgi:hypothetical protein
MTTSALPHDRLVALGAPPLPLGLTYRVRWHGDGEDFLRVELREDRPLFGSDRLARRVIDLREIAPDDVASHVAQACRECVAEQQARTERTIRTKPLLGDHGRGAAA